MNNRYIVGIALGMGGFGITYKCLDTKIGGVCAIKEYFPDAFAMRKLDMRTVEPHSTTYDKFHKLMRRFVEEASLLRTFQHKNIVKVYDCFTAYGTAYYAMEYCNGIDLRRYTNDFRRVLSFEEGMNIMRQVMDGLEYIHDRHMLHRDIAPDNIFITKTKVVKILDFGSTRYEMDQLNRQFSVIIKAGYSPIEQYSGVLKQGSYTDIYAFGAMMYHLFTGVAPMEATQRDINDDRLISISSLRPDLPDQLKYCIDKMLVITVKGRVQSVGEMRAILGSLQAAPMVPRRAPMVKASISKRLGAYGIDCIIYGLIYGMALMLTVGNDRMALWLWALFPVVMMICNTILELIAGLTPGKAIMGLYVKNSDGSKATGAQILLRNFIKLFGIFALFFAKDGVLPEDRATNSVVLDRKMEMRNGIR